jgi:CheY-like chemotaxis protein
MNSGILVLIVEDEPLILLGMQSALEDGGYEILTAVNGTDALAVLDLHHADLAGLITDIRMGDGPTGWDVARHARGLKSEIAVVYVSADRVGDWPVEGLPNSVAIQKPFAEAQLVTAISTLVTEAGSRSAT